MAVARRNDDASLLTPRVAGLLLALLLGSALTVAAYLACVVLLGTTEAAGSAIALASQALWQAVTAGWAFGRSRGWWPAHAACGILAFCAAGLSGLAGGSAFFAVATVALVVMPAGTLVCVRRSVLSARGAS